MGYNFKYNYLSKMKEVEEIKKIRRLSYIIIVSIISFSIFIGSYPSGSLFGRHINKYLVNKFTEYYFTSCLKQKYLELLIDRNCVGREKSIKINNVIIFPKIFTHHLTLKEQEELENYNSNPKNKYEYKIIDNRPYAFDKASSLTEVLMWIIFLLTLPIIWLTRDLSIYGITLINKVGKLISKGWKKI